MSSEAKAGKLGRGDAAFDPASYATVAERITLFYETFPRGRIVTELVSRTERDVVFRALVYRQAEDSAPAATGWAAEREGDGEVNEVACLENTETSAVGRALANLGFTAARERASAEEMAKASRARARLGLVPNDEGYAAVVADVCSLIRRAERCGLRRARSARWQHHITSGRISRDTLLRCERRLRLWVQAHSPPRVG
jgi:hypothetical protein